MIKYSYVIPTYNKKELLRKTLDALNNIENIPGETFEVIVVDDGSSDGTWDYIDGINENYILRYIYLERTEKSCRSRTRNYGWKMAAGEIIIFIDSDIIVQPNHLKEVQRCYKYSDDIVVVGLRLNMPEGEDYEAIYEKYKNGKIDSELFEERHYACDKLSYNMRLHKFPFLMVFSCNLIISKKNLMLVDGFDENMIGWGAEDIDIGYRLFEANKQIITNHKLLCFHQYHESANNGSAESQNSTKYFFDKHDGMFEEVSSDFIFSIYSPHIRGNDRLMRKFRTYPRSLRKRETINVESVEMAEEVKDYILSYEKEDIRVITINDWIEEDDLDLWIQLLDKKNVVIEYYPMTISEKVNEAVLAIVSRMMSLDATNAI